MRCGLRALGWCSVLVLVACQSGAPNASEAPGIDPGVVHRSVRTEVEAAQASCDQGLAWMFGFHFENAVAAFQAAADADPDCAFAHWGIAYAHGPNYNDPVPDAARHAAARAALARAMAVRDGAAPAVQGLIEALQLRFPEALPEDRGPVEAAYAEAMCALRDRFPDDPDVTALCADSLLLMRPWKLWQPDGRPYPETMRARRVLEGGLVKWPNHPMLCHLYIHAMEAGPHVRLALPAARRLEGLVPASSHLVHMPSHIYAWTGHYADVVRSNLAAVAVDRKDIAKEGMENFYSLYRIHNWHFVAYGAMFTGQREVAMDAARELVARMPEGLSAAVPDLFDIFAATPYHVMVRFGMWEELIEEPAPPASRPATTAVWRYARALAYASLSRVEEAEAEQQRFLAAKAAVPASRILFNNKVSDILGVAEVFLAGEIAYRKKEYEDAFRLLRIAVQRDVAMNYDEPWGWMEPARHALGALLTEQGHFEEAVAVYEANLRRYPENGWALHGLAEALRGLGREEEAQAAHARFEKAFEAADVTIPGSCFCKGV